MGDFLSGFSSMFSNADSLANIGKFGSGLGSIYSAYNANSLGNKQMDLLEKQNNLYTQDYEDKKKAQASQNTTFSNVWG
jgi:hypothetical protein